MTMPLPPSVGHRLRRPNRFRSTPQLFHLHLLLLLLILATGGSLSEGCLLENGRSAVYLSIFEELPSGSIVGELGVRGSADSEPPDLRLRVVKAQDLLAVEPRSQRLRVQKRIDRDQGLGKFEAVVECRSTTASADFQHLNISVFVTVKDVNDNAPKFSQPLYDIALPEELPIGTPIALDIEATDLDQPGPNSFVRYAVAPGPYSHLLSLPDPFRPRVHVAARIDYEQLVSFEVQLEARDQGEPSRRGSARLRVQVSDIDDLPPYFDHLYYTATNVKDDILIVEPAQVRAQDGDRTKQVIRYELDGDDASQFSIDPESGLLRSQTASLPADAVLLVHAFQVENREKNATAVVRVRRDAVLRFDYQLYAVQVEDDTPPETQLTQLVALSNNATAKVRYQLEEQAAVVFVDEASGRVLYRGGARRPVYAYNVTASDGRHTAVTQLVVRLGDQANGCAPQWRFERDEFTLEATGRTVLGSLKVVPVTPHAIGQPRFSLLNLHKYVKVDEEGVIRLATGTRLPCALCEVVAQLEDAHGRTHTSLLLIRNPTYLLSSASLLSVLIFTLLALILLVLVIFACRRLYSTWTRSEIARRPSTCWLTKSQGVVFTGGTLTSTGAATRYVLTHDRGALAAVAAAAASKSPPISLRTSVAPTAHLVPVTVATTATAGGGIAASTTALNSSTPPVAPTVYF